MTDLHYRTFATDALDFAEGRLFSRIVPFDISAPVLDELPDGSLDAYVEGFRLGAFKRQIGSSEPGVLRRVALKHDHVGGIGYLGPLVDAQERDDGLYGEFRVLPSMRDDVAALVELGVRELSVEFLERRGGTDVVDGVRWRTDVHLGAVALLPQGAYGGAGAKVLALRGVDEVLADKAEQDRLDAEQVEADRVAAEQADQRRALIDDLDEFLASAKAKQAELDAMLG